MSNMNGECLCGSVKIRVEKINHQVGVCHCAMCRKWTGGPLLAIEAKGKVTLEGKNNIATYQSSDWAERGFCNKCGSHLFYHLIDNDQYIIPVGLFDVSDSMVLDHQIFIEEKPSYYSFAQKTKTMTGEEVFAAFES